MLYAAVSVSAVQKSESAIYIRISSAFLDFPPFRLPQSTEQSPLCYTVGSLQLSVLYIAVYICQSQSPNSSHPLSPIGNHKFVLYIYVSFSALHLSSSVPFFYIPHISNIIQYLFFFFGLTSLYMKVSRVIHISANDTVLFLFMAE